MRIPDGRDCPYYTVNSHRRVTQVEFCHLMSASPERERWTSALCFTCPVPDIRRANACQHLILHAAIRRPGWRLWQKERMTIAATCTQSGGAVSDPYVGCGQCHEPLNLIVGSPPDDDRPEP